ncbi:hypothetical protein CEXT_385981 [Caerostris extrusa]|uniref:Uncharacterized protein n=1 Tax=Caerostris extrusa TaxID=172846 RepID=A0AAV4XTG7_CAEEX|nr:hypothetical protein CEXT_385981 [Caerostris extrusa]
MYELELKVKSNLLGLDYARVISKPINLKLQGEGLEERKIVCGPKSHQLPHSILKEKPSTRITPVNASWLGCVLAQAV